MNSEKVKEIKESLQQEIHLTEYVDSAYSENVSLDLLKDALNLINELESENKKLKQHKIELQGGQRDLTKRIAELEKENALIKNSVAMRDCKTLEEISSNKVKQFAEKLKDKAIRRQEFIGELAIDDIEYVKTQDIDETLKEFKK